LQKLLSHFGSLANVRAASVDELVISRAVNRRQAEAVRLHFQKEKESATT
jgi:excinuclease UvrABC nuclease subunit